jgi:hypothetical protein
VVRISFRNLRKVSLALKQDMSVYSLRYAVSRYNHEKETNSKSKDLTLGISLGKFFFMKFASSVIKTKQS